MNANIVYTPETVWAEIIVGESRAFLYPDGWHTADPDLLVALKEEFRQPFDDLYIPYPHLAHAERAASQLNGKVVRTIQPNSEDKALVY
jgi:hypothetical protein